MLPACRALRCCQPACIHAHLWLSCTVTADNDWRRSRWTPSRSKCLNVFVGVPTCNLTMSILSRVDLSLDELGLMFYESIYLFSLFVSHQMPTQDLPNWSACTCNGVLRFSEALNEDVYAYV